MIPLYSIFMKKGSENRPLRPAVGQFFFILTESRKYSVRRLMKGIRFVADALFADLSDGFRFSHPAPAVDMVELYLRQDVPVF